MTESHNIPFVVVVILNWNNAVDTLAAINSLNQIGYQNYKIIVVDNGSTDASARTIEEAYPNIMLINNEHNLGYAEGNNVGIDYAMNLNADYILILNNDTLVGPSMLDSLIEVAESNHDIGMVGPKVLCAGSTDRIFAAGSLILWKEGDLCHRGMFQLEESLNMVSTPEDVDFLVGCGVLVKRRCIETIGYLPTQYYLNYEDVEWGLRARQQQFRVMYVPTATMWHKVSSTLGIGSPANTYYMTRNALIFFWRYAPIHIRGLITVRITLRTLRTIATWTIKPKYRTEQFRRKKLANKYALRDFFSSRSGRMGRDVERVCYG